MQLNLENSSENTLIRRFRETDSGSEILIGEETYHSSIILTPTGVSLWQVTNINGLGLEDIQQLSELTTEVIILGTGKQIQFPNPEITRPMVEKQKGLEVMDTAAACRTYNILLSDGRSVSAALILDIV